MATQTKRRQVVMAFDERHDLSSPRIRGGKGASLVDMRALGLPVPPGFTISTSVARAVMQHGAFPKRFEWQLARGIESLERATGRKFGDVKNPLLVSVRSGAEVSMPGMMDTILNLGMTPAIHHTMAGLDREFADTSWYRFVSMYNEIIFGSEKYSGLGREYHEVASRIPTDAYEQLRQAITAVIRSWSSKRAIDYRKECGISDALGTAVTVQTMVFGNRDNNSGSGVVFSRNPNTGERGLYGEYLPGTQGETIVSGSTTPMPISAMEAWNANLYQELAGYVAKLEQHFDSIVDVEFTIEEGKLWLLQCRAARLTAVPAATFAVHQVWDKKWTKEKAIESLTKEQLAALDTHSAFAPEDIVKESPQNFAAEGLAASPGVAVGRIAWTSQEAVAMKARGEAVVLVRHETDPNDLFGMLAADAIVTFNGGATSHAAVVARQLGKPAVVGATSPTLQVLGKSFAYREVVLSVCGNTGFAYFGELPIISKVSKKEINIFQRWLYGRFAEPKIDFGAAKKRESVNRILAEVYLLDAMSLAAKGSILKHEVMKLRNKTLVESAEFLVAYLAVAVVGELRHAWSQGVRNHVLLELKKMEDVFGINGSQDRGDESILPILAPRPIAAQVEFFELAALIFNRGWGKSTGIGGAKWAAIAQAGADFLSGTLNHGVFVDHVFDLRHNGGRLFDKHNMVTSYTDEMGIRAQLNCKRDESKLENLYTDLVKFLRPDDPYNKRNLSREFAQLWEKGKKLNLWKEREDAKPPAYKPSIRRHEFGDWGNE